MKKTLVFSIVWTFFAAWGTIAIWTDQTFEEEAPIVRLGMTAMPVFGLWFVWWSFRRFKRYRSVQTVTTDTGTHYSWTDIDGTQRSSDIDPRIEWDEDDRLDDK